MMSSTLGAPFDGTTRGGHHGVDSEAFSLMTPPNFGGDGGSCLLSIVVVAPGDPGTPGTCWADAGTLPRTTRAAVVANAQERIFISATSHLTILQGCRL